MFQNRTIVHEKQLYKRWPSRGKERKNEKTTRGVAALRVFHQWSAQKIDRKYIKPVLPKNYYWQNFKMAVLVNYIFEVWLNGENIWTFSHVWPIATPFHGRKLDFFIQELSQNIARSIQKLIQDNKSLVFEEVETENQDIFLLIVLLSFSAKQESHSAARCTE